MPEARVATDPTGRSRDRIDALSDAVFAIALTLLSLSIVLVQRPDESFGRAFRETIPQIYTFVLSFVVIALFWIGHHRFFASLRFADHGLVLWNFFYLGIVALLPFPSQVLGDYGDEPGAVVLYASMLVVGSLTGAFLWEYARRRELLDVKTPRRLVKHSIGHNLVVAAVFLLSIPVALIVGPTPAELSWLLVIPAQLVLRHRYGRLHDAVW